MKITKILVLINLFFLQSYLIRFEIGPYPSNLQEILIAITFVSFLVETIKLKRVIQTLKNIWKYKKMLILTFLSILSFLLIVSGKIEIFPPLTQNIDFLRHVKFLVFAVLLSFPVLETFKTEKQRNGAIYFAGLGALTFGLFSLIYNLLGFNITHDSRLLGPLDSAVYLAFYLTPFFIYFTLKYFDSQKKRSYLIFAILLGLLIIGTRSMGAIGAGFLCILIFTLRRKNLKILKSNVVKIALAIITIAIVGIIFYSKILPTLQTDYSSLDERGEIWKVSYELLKEPKNALLGIGFGQFENNFIINADQILGCPPLDYAVIQPHNVFLLFIFHYGILGFFFVAYILANTIRKILSKQTHLFSYIAAFILAYFLIHGMIDTPFFKNDMLILLIIFMEMGLGKTNSIRKPNP